ncbi:uncharacterized protein [Physcomitrium patens]|uniref:uncharacterized protein isoform X2 n=1 Tax=Physcomitrium patens TaxID=3218 RepID=UPI000D1636C8|nr:uncharacterized protein LOC112293401 isoform X2 [Physcomitrium patens]|eukprot:XP_024398502.1 uncharacterized protein LOC112293401 isoform X2 [Physcomitrella patens]
MGTTPAQQSVINLTWLGNHEKLHKLHLYRRGDTYTNETVMICHPKDTRRNRAVLQIGIRKGYPVSASLLSPSMRSKPTITVKKNLRSLTFGQK